MSMREYATVDFGFLFPEEAVLTIARVMMQEWGVNFVLDDEEEKDLLSDYYLSHNVSVELNIVRQELVNRLSLNVEQYSSFTGEVETIPELIPFVRGDSIFKIFEDGDVFLFLPLNKGPALIGTAYDTAEDILSEVNNALSLFAESLMNAGVDIAANIVSLKGTVFG